MSETCLHSLAEMILLKTPIGVGVNRQKAAVKKNRRPKDRTVFLRRAHHPSTPIITLTNAITSTQKGQWS